MISTLKQDILYWGCNADQCKTTEQTKIKVSWLIALCSLITKVFFHSHWGIDHERCDGQTQKKHKET